MTGFEENVANGDALPAWTTLGQETAFLTDLAATHANVKVQQLGLSVNGNPIRLVTVGTGATTVLIVAQQHGQEAAGREAAFQTMRALAETTDAAVSAYLEEVTVAFIPTVNPDYLGVKRENGNNVDLNRDHLALSQPETRAVHRAIRDLAPVMVFDCHEGRDTQVSEGMEFQWPRMTQIPAALRNAAEEIVQEHLRPAIADLGFPHGLYHEPPPDRANLTNTASLRYALTVLGETARSDTVNSPPRINRVAMQAAAQDAFLAYHRPRVSTLNAQRAKAVAASLEAARRRLAYDLQTGVSVEVWGYRLTTVQQAALAHHFELFRFSAVPDGDDFLVPMYQPARTLIPLVMDGSAAANTVAATRLTAHPRGKTHVTQGIRLAGRLHSVGGLRLNGRTRTITAVRNTA